MNIDASQSQQTSQHLESKAGVGASVQALYAHLMQLAVERLYAVPVPAQPTPFFKSVGFHVGSVPGYQMHSVSSHGRSQRSLDGGTDVPFVSVHTCSFGQTHCQLIDGSEVMPSPRQQRKAHRHSLWGAYKVQPPPKKAPRLSATLAEEMLPIRVTSVDLTTPEGSHSFAHRHRHTVYDEGLPCGEQLPHQMRCTQTTRQGRAGGG